VTGEFTPPASASAAFTALYAGLKTFAANFEEHIRLEDEVLFPRAIAMEEELMRGGVQ
jgi:regulator of cell morphogenesis and NO signaling